MTLVLIDGRSGAGKTTLAATFSGQIVHMDEFYPGWAGLQAGSDYLLESLERGRYQAWDWARGARSAHWIVLGDDLVVEGVGCLTRATRPLADRAIWIELDAATRRRRALEREPYFAAHWDDWAAQEDAFIARERPMLLADELR